VTVNWSTVALGGCNTLMMWAVALLCIERLCSGLAARVCVLCPAGMNVCVCVKPIMILLCLLDRSEWACGTVSTGGHLAEMDTHTSGKVTVPTTASNNASAWSPSHCLLTSWCPSCHALPVMPCHFLPPSLRHTFCINKLNFDFGLLNSSSDVGN